MINVICVKWGTKYSSSDVNRLKRNVEKYLTIPHKFICYTEDPTDLECDIISIPADNDLEIYWNKLAMFQKDFIEGTCLYFDIDVVIQNNIDNILDYLCDDLTMIRCYWKGDTVTYGDLTRFKDRYDMYVNSSMLLWKGGSLSNIWEYFDANADYYMVKYKGIDRFLFHEGFTLKYFPQGIAYSRIHGIKENDYTIEMYLNTNHDFEFYYDPDALVCMFNGPTTKEMYEPFKHHWQ